MVFLSARIIIRAIWWADGEIGIRSDLKNHLLNLKYEFESRSAHHVQKIALTGYFLS